MSNAPHKGGNPMWFFAGFFGVFYVLCLGGNTAGTLKWTAIILAPFALIWIWGAIRICRTIARETPNPYEVKPALPRIDIPGNGDAPLPMHGINEPPAWKAKRPAASYSGSWTIEHAPDAKRAAPGDWSDLLK